MVQRFEEGRHGAGEGLVAGEWEGCTQLTGREFTLRQRGVFLRFSPATFSSMRRRDEELSVTRAGILPDEVVES